MNAKKQILVVFTGTMELGGIERSLLGLLDAIDYERYDVDLFLYGHHGPLFELINPKVNLLPEIKELAYLRDSLKEKLRHGCYYSAFLRLKDSLLSFGKPIDFDKTWAKIVQKYAPRLEKHYDLALSFFRPFDFISDKVDADYKLGWIHTDYTGEETNLMSLYDDYKRVDKIIAVSEQCKNTFCKILPNLSERIVVMENILSRKFILEQAECKISDPQFIREQDICMLLSIGRFSYPKNFDNIPDICKCIIKKGKIIKWYIIGFGSEEELIRKSIIEANMQEYVIILGKRDNPYPYLKECDIYVQPSRYEGKAVTVREAQMLGKPVIITDYATSASQLEDGIDGVIVPQDNEGCANGIIELLDNQEKMKKLRLNCQKRDYSNMSEIQKLYKMVKNEDKNNYLS